MRNAPFNLLHEQWIPARRQSGEVEWIAPWQMTDDLDSNPFVTLAAPRPDFNGALTEFLIGLLATTAAPEDEEEWREKWQSPPSPETLQKSFEKYTHAFNLDGDGPRFMQDLDGLDDQKEEPVASLLIDAPGQQTLRKNADLFVKRKQELAMCRATAAMALYTLQTYAPSGGAGHRTSLRGGGPLTTLLIAERNKKPVLWGRLWPNVPTKENIDEHSVNYARDEGGKNIFPWLGPTRTSQQQGGCETTRGDVHPLQMFWGMPRRIRLIFSPAGSGEICALMQQKDTTVIHAYRTRNYGINYSEGWQHVLSPYYKQNKNSSVWLPRHAGINGVSYRHWLEFVIPDQENTRPALVILNSARRQSLRKDRSRLIAFGYDMDNMKARSWIESEMPVYEVSDYIRDVVKTVAQEMIEAAEIVSGMTVGAIKRAWFDAPREARGDFSFISDRFWRDTEAKFFDILNEILKRAEEKVTEFPEEYKLWLDTVQEEAFKLFDEYASTEELQFGNAERLVGARYGLVTALSGYGAVGKKLFGALRLPIPGTKKQRNAA